MADAKAQQKTDGGAPDQRTGVQAIVEPIKAGGGVAGFAIGFLAEWRSGGDFTASAMHGLLGAALLWMLAWFVALYLVRAMMTHHIDEQRRLYTERVEAARARSQGETPGLQKVPRATLGPPGS